MKKSKRMLSLILSLALTATLSGCGSGKTPDTISQGSQSSAASGGTEEGVVDKEQENESVIRIAFPEEPATLDTMLNTVDNAVRLGQQVFECLYVYDENMNLQPMLVESDEVSEDGLTATMHLRKGVKFHNGKEMTSADVKASLDRWIANGVRASLIRDYVNEVVADDDYTVSIKFNKPYGPWKNIFAFYCGCCYIVPSEIAEAAGTEALSEEQYIGTGPYRFVEHQDGNAYFLEKFDEYCARSEEANGPAGKREAIADKLCFYVVKDVNTRTTGLKAGDYDYAYMLSGDMFDSLSKESSLVTTVNAGAMNGVVFVNNTAGILADNYRLRHALQTAINSEDVLMAALGAKELYNMCPEIYPEGFFYHSGRECPDYNQGNAEKAAQMAKDAGYNGETITFYVNTNYQNYVNMCTVIIEQLKQAGFNIDAQYLEGATMMAQRKEPENWDLFFTHMSMNPLPLVYDVMNTSYAGWWTTPERNELFDSFVAEMDDDARREIWGDIQELIYTQLPIMDIGHFFDYDVYSSRLTGLPEHVNIYPYFWGVDVQ